MTVHEVVKSLRYICAVLKEYNATEQRKRAEARRRAEEAARRKAEEAAAREAELKAAQERLLAQTAAKTTGRRRPRRGDGPRASTPIEARPSIPSTPNAFASTSTDWGAETPSSRGLSSGLVALMTQLGRLNAALRDLFTVTKTSRAWYKKISTDKQWGPALHGLMSGLMMLAVRIAGRMFHRDRLLAWQRKWIDYDQRVERMLEGDWREKVRYLLWANGQQQARQAAVAA